MADFTPAFAFLMSNEDPHRRYAVSTDSNGAPTISGINGKFYPEVVEQLAAMPQGNRGPAVATFYYNLYFKPNLARLTSQSVCSKLMDMAVNMSTREAVLLAQRAVNHFHVPNIAADGVFGSETLAAINSAPEDVMVQALCAEARKFYDELAEDHPAKAPDKTLEAWEARAAKIPA